MTNKMNIPFSPPDITQEEIDEVAEALRSGWITTGPRVKELERQLAEVSGSQALRVSQFSDGLRGNGPAYSRGGARR